MEKSHTGRVLQHYDYVEAYQYAKANNRELKDLSYQEMQIFKCYAQSIKTSEMEKKGE